MKHNSGHVHLALFFTRGVSLVAWDRAGILERELALYHGLMKAGLEVSLLTYGGPEDLAYLDRAEGINILCNRWRLPPRVYERFLPYVHFRALRRCDVFKTNQTRGADIALRAARFHRKPLIARSGYCLSEFEANHHGANSAGARAARKIEKMVFARAQRIVVTTSRMADQARSQWPAAGVNIRVIPNYVDTNTFRPRPSAEKNVDIIYVGRLADQKNLFSLLEAIRPTKLTAMIVGQGPLREPLEADARAMNGRVSFWGKARNPDLPEILNQARIFVLASHFEGHPKALIEAMACGLAVVGADSPGIRELLDHDVTGVICQPEADSLREAIEDLIANPLKREGLGRKARRYAEENFALDLAIDAELAVIKEVHAS